MTQSAVHTPERRRQPLFPHEHGAYAQIALPLGAALAGARPTAAGVLFAAAACAAFVAHEPLLVVLGHRGARARREALHRASRWFATTMLASVTLAAGCFVLSPVTRPWMAVPAALTAIAALFIVRRSERTLAGELVACAALTSSAIPTAIACGIRWREAVALWAVFYSTSILSTLEVRTVARRETTPLLRSAIWSSAMGLLLTLFVWRPRFAIAALPMLVAVLGIAVTRPRPTKLRRLGWILATASVMTAVAVTIAVRSPG